MATILIVDDAASRQLLVPLLRPAGYDLLEAANGAEALDAVRFRRPDLVITAVLMPVMDGFGFVRQLRLDPATTAIPVVFYTAYFGAQEARALALSGGVSHMLMKPAQRAEMLAAVESVLSSGPDKEGLPPDAPLSGVFDREHLRLVTNKLSENTDDLIAANARLRALINIGLEIASERDRDRLLQSVCVAAHGLFRASYVTLGILDQSSRAVRSCVTWGTTTAEWLRPGDAVSGFLQTVVLERRTLRGHNPGGQARRLELPANHPDVCRTASASAL